MYNKEKIKEIFKKYKDEIKIIRKEYAFLQIPEDDFIMIVLKEINKSLKYSEEEYYLNYLMNKIGISLRTITIDYLMDNDKSYIVINNYINSMFKITNNESIIIKNFDTIEQFFEKNSYFPTDEMIKKIIINNDIIHYSLSFIYNKHKKNINDGKINQLFNNQYMISFIRLYCEINNIKFKDDIIINKDDSLIDYSDSLKMYINNIPPYKPFTIEEEKNIFQRIKKGDEKARQLIIENNLKLVISIAQKYTNPYMSLMDLIEEGNIGLIKAVNKFDEQKGLKFSTYAFFWIKESIIKSIANKGRMIRIPYYISEKIGLYTTACDSLYMKLNREPSDNEIAQYMNVSLSTIDKIKKYRQGILSLDNYINDEEDETIGNFVVDTTTPNPQDVVIDISLQEEINKLLNSNIINEREIEILKMRFGFLEDQKCYSLEEIGEKFHVTRERIRQLQNKILVKIKHSYMAKNLSIYLDNNDSYYKQR